MLYVQNNENKLKKIRYLISICVYNVLLTL